MKNLWRICGAGMLGILLLAGTAAGQSKSAAAFDRMKTLAGEWEGNLGGGATGRATYKLVSNGTALLETIYGEEHSDGMITVYHADGESLLATHYCAVGNQPRLRAILTAGKTDALTFRLVDVSNVKPSQESQMNGLVVRFEDADHFTQEWTATEKGKTTTSMFRWTRKK